MTSREFIEKVFRGDLGPLDAYNKSFDFTIGEKPKIEMLIAEIDHRINGLRYAMAQEWVYDTKEMEDPNFGSDPSHEDLLRDKNLEYERKHYPNLLKSLNQLKTDLSDFLESQNEESTSGKPQPKNVWGLAARYNFIKELGVLKQFENMTNQTTRAKIISQILACSFDNAKKLKNGAYQSDETNEEQLERKQLIELIKHHQADKKG